MKIFKKLAVSVNSHVDTMANRFENREALSLSYIKEYEKVVAKSKVKLAQMDNEVKRLTKEVKKYQDDIELWAERAKKIHMTDQNKALECVSRMKTAQKKQETVESDLQEAQALRTSMFNDVELVHEKLKTLKRKHQNLSGRQVCADAVHAIQRVDTDFHHEIDELYTRWETDVVATELHHNHLPTEGDPLADEFDSLEEKQDLQKSLDDLIASSK